MAECILETVCRLVAYLVVLPVCLIVATPFILISAPFWQGGVKSGYAAIFRWWQWGINIT